MVHNDSQSLDLGGPGANDLVMAPLDELLAAVRGLKEPDWRGYPAQAIDHAHRQRLIRLLVGRAEAADLRDFFEYLSRAAARARRFRVSDGGGATDWAARWLALADVVDLRVAGRRTQAPARALERAHVRELVRVVGDYQARDPEGMPQSALGEALGLKKANLTRVLNLLEANELVERRGLGRENRIRLGVAGRAWTEQDRPAPSQVPPQSSATPAQAVQKRGIDYLSSAA